MSGRLAVVGLGPGNGCWLTPEADAALAAADAVYGYGAYLDRVPARPGQARHPSDNREEQARAAAALGHSATGANVAVVSGGDPGVFAMAAAVCAEVEFGPPGWRDLEVVIIPGITAMLAVAARAGAPLGHDFCALSLSDNLKPWETIERRLDAAARAGFVIAIYNPVSRARPWQLGAAFDRVARLLPETTPVVFGRAVGRDSEQVEIATLATANAVAADMATLVIIGSADTRVIERAGRPPLVYHLLHAFDGGDLRQRRPAQQDDRQRQRPRRGDLAVGGRTAAVLGDDNVDAVFGEQRAFVLFGERAAGGDVDRVRHAERRLNRVDAADEVVVLRRGPEWRNFLASEGQKDAARCGAKGLDGVRHLVYLDPAISRNRHPAGPAHGHQRDAGPRRGGGCVGGNRRRVGMRRIDESVYFLVAEVVREPFGAAEAAGPDRHGLGRRLGGAPGERERHVETGARRKACRELPRLRRAAENEDAHVAG
jgi:precorrin-3B C17-methyltransferase